MPTSDSTLATVFRHESPAVLAALVRISGDLDLAEDALQEALAVASERWKSDGVPANPGGWIMTTARRRLIDDHRRAVRGDAKQRSAGLDWDLRRPPSNDDRLMLIFTCCHPAINLESRVALTLRTVCGLTTEEIAAAFLVPVSTMAQRIVRAKNKIKVAKIAYVVPDPDIWDRRLPAVLATIYLVFSRGNDLVDDGRGDELCDVSIDLARLLNLLIPSEPDIEGLLALMLLSHARRHSRTNVDGGIVVFQDQDRTRWDQGLIREALGLLARARRHGSVGQYWLQAAIAAEHVAPDDLSERDWSAIVALYDQLLQQTHQSPVVRLNRAVALAELAGPEAALAEVDSCEEPLAGYVPFHVARAHLLKQLDRHDEAASGYRRAIALAEDGPQRDALVRTLGEIETAGQRCSPSNDSA